MSIKTMPQKDLDFILDFEKIIAQFWLRVIDEAGGRTGDGKDKSFKGIHLAIQEDLHRMLDRLRSATQPSSPPPPERSPSAARTSPPARDARGRFAKRSKTRSVSSRSRIK